MHAKEKELYGVKKELVMPFKSKAQARFMFSKKPALAQEFADATKSIKKLPEYVKVKSKGKVRKKK